MKFKLKLDELDLDILASIDKNIITDQRKLSSIIGASLGKINYCLKGLINIGFVKIENFSNSQNKIKYVYILTPKGIEAKVSLTKYFLRKKIEEYEKLQEYL
jgi:EPS-associated MarR family transcriptional regulator